MATPHGGKFIGRLATQYLDETGQYCHSSFFPFEIERTWLSPLEVPCCEGGDMGNAVREGIVPHKSFYRLIVGLSHCELETILDIKRCIDRDGEEA